MADSSRSATSLPSAIYVWLDPGTWRIRKWDTKPFPEANFTLAETELEHKRLLDIEHLAWHMMDDSTEHTSTGEVTVMREDYEALSKLLAEDHPTVSETVDRREIVKQAADRVMPGVAAVLGSDAAIAKAAAPDTVTEKG